MKKLLLSLLFILVCSAAFAKPLPPVEPVYSEVYTIADCLNAYEGTTCIINGSVTGIDNTYHHNRYIIQDSTGEMAANFSHHVIGNNTDITSGTYKIIGEIRGVNHHPDMYRAPKHRLDPHLAVRYMEKQ